MEDKKIKTKEKQLNRQATKLAGIVLLVLAIVIYFALNAQSQYIVVVDYDYNKTIVRKAPDMESLNKIVKAYFPKSKIDIEEFMKYSIYFEIRRYDFRFYIERRKIINGKYRKLSKKEIKNIESK